MKILIVDDEILVRIGIKSCAEWDKLGMEIIGEAEDGLKAIELIESLKPDIILLDIKMPRMDGLQVMRHIKERDFDCRVVILSSFDDFEHIGEAMKYGMADYLHKPRMSSQDIVNALLSAKESIDKSRAQKSEELNHHIIPNASAMPKETLLKQLLSGVPGSSGQVGKMIDKSMLKLGNYNISCTMFSVLDIGTVMKRYESQGRNVLQAYVNNIMHGILEAEKGTEYLSYNDNVHVIITSSDHQEGERRAFSKLHALVDLITDALMRFLNVKAAFGASDVFQGMASLSLAFAQASRALDMHFYRDSKTCIYYRELAEFDVDEVRRQIDKLVEVLRQHLSDGKYDNFSDAFDELIELISLNACLSRDEVRGLFNGLLFLTRGGQSSLTDMEELAVCETFSELCQSYKRIFHNRVGSMIKPEYTFHVKRIMSYIYSNYVNEITLKTIAEALQISPNYVSRIFKAETGEPLFEYINSIRIENAKRLLSDSSLKIYEIGYMVGYKSPVHFTVVFSKLMKMSPKQYRDMLRV